MNKIDTARIYTDGFKMHIAVIFVNQHLRSESSGHRKGLLKHKGLIGGKFLRS